MHEKADELVDREDACPWFHHWESLPQLMDGVDREEGEWPQNHMLGAVAGSAGKKDTGLD